MTFKLLLSVVSLALGSLPAIGLAAIGLAAIGAPVQTAQAELGTSSTSNDIYQTCKQNADAVVTLYAGAEIGTGSIVSPDGLVITNYHVVQEAVQSKGKTKIYVKLKNGTRYMGRVIGQPDQPNDLAVLKLDTQATFTKLIALAEPSSVSLGQPVCAIGNPFGLTSVGVGTLQAFRGSNDLKSSNIYLLRGNSGGPLLNQDGKMIGVNKSILLSATGENTGISFATKIQVARVRINDAQTALKRNPGNAAANPAPLPPGDSSLQIANRPVASGGVLGAIIDAKTFIIRQIVLDSPADVDKLRPGYLITAVNDKPLKKLADLQTVLNRHPESIKFTVRSGQTILPPIRVNLKQNNSRTMI